MFQIVPKNIGHFTSDPVLLLGQTPSGKITANIIFAQNRSIASKGR
jgi:hypothetical protein